MILETILIESIKVIDNRKIDELILSLHILFVFFLL